MGLLNKLKDGEFGLDVSAMKRKAFVHGDALSCITHANSKFAIAKRGTVPGNEELVKDLLGAHSCTIMQKGVFHQLMHQASVIYTKFYGGFMQALQIELAVKRVVGTPEKIHFQDHEKYMRKLYRGCRRYRFGKFIESLTPQDLEHDSSITNKKSLLSLENKMIEFNKQWLTSDHEPS